MSDKLFIVETQYTIPPQPAKPGKDLLSAGGPSAEQVEEDLKKAADAHGLIDFVVTFIKETTPEDIDDDVEAFLENSSLGHTLQ